MEHFGVWKGREVYTTTHAEYVRYEYYKPDTTVAFWITDDDNYFVADNRIVGKVIRGPAGVSIDDSVKIAGSKYYYAAWDNKKHTEALKEKLCEEIGVSKEVLFTDTSSSVDEILAGVYTSKLWED